MDVEAAVTAERGGGVPEDGSLRCRGGCGFPFLRPGLGEFPVLDALDQRLSVPVEPEGVIGIPAGAGTAGIAYAAVDGLFHGQDLAGRVAGGMDVVYARLGINGKACQEQACGQQSFHVISHLKLK